MDGDDSMDQTNTTNKLQSASIYYEQINHRATVRARYSRSISMAETKSRSMKLTRLHCSQYLQTIFIVEKKNMCSGCPS